MSYMHRRIRLQPLEHTASTSVRVSLLPTDGGQPALTSGAYTDNLSGAVTPLGMVSAGKYILVPSTEGDVGGKFKMTVYSSNAVTIE